MAAGRPRGQTAQTGNKACCWVVYFTIIYEFARFIADVLICKIAFLIGAGMRPLHKSRYMRTCAGSCVSLETLVLGPYA